MKCPYCSHFLEEIDLMKKIDWKERIDVDLMEWECQSCGYTKWVYLDEEPDGWWKDGL